ncbi:hypothetical protein WN944_025037 [Citrus x changshan-huyou]|uniref:Uncharacterized protein n=1 Tax=Citrus x changshan-huyou TaxID=2935761 RepID=A0AAP0QBU9_9ROSI
MLKNCERREVDGNNFSGSSIPEFIGSLSKLSYLVLSNAEFAGPIPPQLGNLSRLQVLDIGFNSLISGENLEWLSHLSSLIYLDLSFSNLSKFSNWIQVLSKLDSLKALYLISCDLPPTIPSSDLYLNSSTSLEVIDLLGNNLTDSIYPWLFNVSSNLVELINLGSNQLQGSIPEAFGHMPSLNTLFLASNQFREIPKFLGNMCNLKSLTLSYNTLRGDLSEIIQNLSGGCTKTSLEWLFLDSNEITGSLPDFGGFSSLKRLSIANNRLNGTINKSVGQLVKLESLFLHNNSLRGVISEAFLSNLSNLTILYLADNSLTLEFSHDWIPPFQLSQILDLSSNNISGIIPKCFNNFTAMTHEKCSNLTLISNYYTSLAYDSLKATKSYFDKAVLTWKGSQYEYQSTLGLVKILDLSSNKLGGEVPEEIMDLAGLIALNLSRNTLTGQITPKIGQLKSLDFLDLSRNQFFGGIPSSLSQLSRLSVMDLSYNNLEKDGAVDMTTEKSEKFGPWMIVARKGKPKFVVEKENTTAAERNQRSNIPVTSRFDALAEDLNTNNMVEIAGTTPNFEPLQRQPKSITDHFHNRKNLPLKNPSTLKPQNQLSKGKQVAKSQHSVLKQKSITASTSMHASIRPTNTRIIPSSSNVPIPNPSSILPSLPREPNSTLTFTTLDPQNHTAITFPRKTNETVGIPPGFPRKPTSAKSDQQPHSTQPNESSEAKDEGDRKAVEDYAGDPQFTFGTNADATMSDDDNSFVNETPEVYGEAELELCA